MVPTINNDSFATLPVPLNIYLEKEKKMIGYIYYICNMIKIEIKKKCITDIDKNLYIGLFFSRTNT